MSNRTEVCCSCGCSRPSKWRPPMASNKWVGQWVKFKNRRVMVTRSVDRKTFLIHVQSLVGGEVRYAGMKLSPSAALALWKLLGEYVKDITKEEFDDEAESR